MECKVSVTSEGIFRYVTKGAMQLTDQLCTLPKARRLDELGFKGESQYYHNKLGFLDVILFSTKPEDWKYRAYSCAELMDALPHYIKNGKVLQIHKWRSCYIVAYGGEADEAHITKNKNLAEALADMLIWLIQEGLYIVNKE